MTKLKFGTENEGVEFAEKVSELIRYLQESNETEFALVVRKLMSDNIKLFKRLEELEDEPIGEERDPETDSSCN